MARIPAILLLAAFAASTAAADVLIVESRGKPKIEGLDDEIDGTEVTLDNWRIFLPKSEGVVLEHNYDSVLWKRNERTRREETFPIAQVIEVALAPGKRHPALDEGYQYLAQRNLAGAIRAYQECASDEKARPVDRHEASFQVGYTYAAFGRLKSAKGHFEKWNGGKSIHTPEAYRLLAEIYTGEQKFADARKTYQRIIDLPDLPDALKLKGEAGLVKVDIAERNYEEAERKAAALARTASRDEKLNDGRAFAMGLQAQAIIFAKDEKRLPESEQILRSALELASLTDSTKAFLYSTLGDALYAQRKLREARFPYMRVVELYPEESGYVANSLLNAGNCFIDLAGEAQNNGNEATYCDYMIKGMLLISECGLKHKGTTAARQAGGVWRKNKAAYEACKKKQATTVKSDTSEKKGR